MGVLDNVKAKRQGNFLAPKHLQESTRLLVAIYRYIVTHYETYYTMIRLREVSMRFGRDFRELRTTVKSTLSFTDFLRLAIKMGFPLELSGASHKNRMLLTTKCISLTNAMAEAMGKLESDYHKFLDGEDEGYRIEGSKNFGANIVAEFKAAREFEPKDIEAGEAGEAGEVEAAAEAEAETNEPKN